MGGESGRLSGWKVYEKVGLTRHLDLMQDGLVILWDHPCCRSLHFIAQTEALRSLWSILIRLCRRMLYIRVEVSRYAATTLFEAGSSRWWFGRQ